ncbi:unnamed protein product [Alternaria sp. RS040]
MAQMVAENNRDWIFIDALCINQDDETEKLSQVSAMGEVYQRALEVIAWIVPDPDQCESDAEEASDETADGPEHTLPLSRQQVKDIRCPDVSPLTNKTAAENILFHRKRGSFSLRAGNRIPFHQAFAFFAMQDCARPHDKVFGYLGLTKSRIQVDYSVSIIDLFVATLADYLMSVGLITDDLTPIRRRMEYMRTGFGTVNGNKLITAIAAFNLDLHDPVVNLLFYEVLKFFVPGWEKVLHTDAMIHWWMARYVESAERDLFAPIPGDCKFELIKIGTICVRVIKYFATSLCAEAAMRKEICARQKALAQDDAVLTEVESGETKKYSEWAAHARAISNQMWQRFQESGEDADGELDDESWVLVA